MKSSNYNCLVVLGATASGKTRLACELAYQLKGEIISADSRQVYRGLDIGTGKDLNEYQLNGKQIPYHLIDVCEIDTQFYFPDFIRLLKKIFLEITSRDHLPIICGGTGLYLEALEKDHSFTQIPENLKLREKLSDLSKKELIDKLQNYQFGEDQKLPNTTNTVDLNSKKRIIRAIEIEEYLKTNPYPQKEEIIYKPKYIGISQSKKERNEKIDTRLKIRLANGLIEEVEGLLQKGMVHDRLQYLGLEYKFVSHYLLGKITSKEELYNRLCTAIHQYAKRQMTWFRRMERNGVNIEWVDAKSFNTKKFKF